MYSTPLVPFANRIRGGKFSCDGIDIVLAPNSPPDPSPMHGQGWRGIWQVEYANATSIRLIFNHNAGEWPWNYVARQVLKLDAAGLSATLTCCNLW